MSAEQLLVSWAQWLNEHTLALTLLLTALALLAELATRRADDDAGVRRAWAKAWSVNVTLFAGMLTVSWMLSPWLSPAFNMAFGSQFGLLNRLGIPAISYLLYVLAGVLLLDLLMYVLHRTMHAVPLLWRLHQVHHSDEQMNASTHFRQHPGQVLAVTLLQLPALWLLGIPAVSWVFYAAISTVLQLWQHSACSSMANGEQGIERFLVTPSMHRVHHDTRAQFHHSNYGAVLAAWDRLLGTYRALPRDFRAGLPSTAQATQSTFLAVLDCLTSPFKQSIPSSPALAKSRFQPRSQGKA